ncbi:MAG: ATP-binding cassette domain-containing protein [Acidaminococcaceae bacterium]
MIKTQPDFLSSGLLGKLLVHLEIPVPQGALDEACSRSKNESTDPVQQLGFILKAVNRRNVRAAILRWDRFDHRQLPALLWRKDEWWLAETGEDGFIHLTNEAGEGEDISSDELGETGVLWLQALGQRNETRFQTFRSESVRLMLTEILRQKRWLVEVLTATFVVNVLTVAASLFTMQVYDRVVPSFAYATLWALVMGMFIVVVLDWSLKMIRSRILDSVARDVDQRVSQKLYERLMQLRLDTRPHSVGTMAAQVNGLETVRAFFSSSIVFALADCPFAFFFIACIGIIGGSMGWVYLLLLILGLIIGVFFQFRMRELSRKEIQRGHERHGLLVDTIQGAETIQSSGAEWRFAEMWRELTSAISCYTNKSRGLSNLTQITTGTLGTLAYVSAVVVGVFEIEAGRLTTGGIIACTILGGRVIGPVAQGVQNMMQWQYVRESLQMVDNLLEHQPTRGENQDLLVPEKLDVNVQLEGVKFAYQGTPVLRLNVNQLSFKAGDRVAIVGANGSGKSTLLKVIAGLYQPTGGQIRLGGADIWELDPQIINQYIGYLPQDVHLFRGTLRSNMTLAGGISDARVLSIAKELGIDRIAADSARGMEMEISEGGQGLSGGQRQLVALSRIFLAAPKVWLLDEPTASLDDESERHVIEALQKRIQPDDILLVSTHRPRTIALSNRMIVMARGRIVLDGPTAEVIKHLQALNVKQTKVAVNNGETAHENVVQKVNGEQGGTGNVEQ